MSDHPSKEYKAFSGLVDKLLTVPKSALHARMAEHREKADQNPSKPGPKPKARSRRKKRP